LTGKDLLISSERQETLCMMRLLIAGVIVITLSALAAKRFFSTDDAITPDAASTQINEARQDINEAVNQELERAKDLNQPSE
jgi:DNA/RNA endonuclease YhcR with UshA esterase domain